MFKSQPSYSLLEGYGNTDLKASADQYIPVVWNVKEMDLGFLHHREILEMSATSSEEKIL